MSSDTQPHKTGWLRGAVWAARVLLGVTFILSGWAKCIDPWGFVYKAEEYLAVWHIAAMVPREFTLVGTAALSMFEFCTGLLLATGCLRRSAAWCAAAIMAAMLPLSLYIFLADPVSDCGCFGDLFVLSNGATFAKNIVLAALAVFLVIYNRRATPGYRPGIQWLVAALAIIYSLTLVVVGWQVQPMVDFRQWPVGTALSADETGDGNAPEDMTFIYEKDGATAEFPLDALPDSTWTYVKRSGADSEITDRPAFFDNDGYEVTDDILGADSPDDRLILLTVPEPGLDNLLRARFANELYEYSEANGIRMAAAVAASGQALDRWSALARPDFPVYSASDTSLKELVRGPMGLVYLRGGTIALKRNFAALAPELPEAGDGDPFEAMMTVSDGRLAAWISGALAAALLLLWIMGKTLARKPNPVKTVIKK